MAWNTYGFPRLYRRILNIERRLIRDGQARAKWEGRIKLGFRWPNILMQKAFSKSTATELRKEGAKRIGLSEIDAQRWAQQASDNADKLISDLAKKKTHNNPPK
ncbi:hypothetical protein EV182_000995 [Spiromyces aspiralis]|uniref:Uncharacterized protein n=1 Tax=Spiromyces aspiralis TaxID=68401 RepID=A0ACC1HXJ3_9FUNG|nr:hypothetical protein EV182_000995 [Spiromyces aspiralis]